MTKYALQIEKDHEQGGWRWIILEGVGNPCVYKEHVRDEAVYVAYQLALEAGGEALSDLEDGHIRMRHQWALNVYWAEGINAWTWGLYKEVRPGDWQWVGEASESQYYDTFEQALHEGSQSLAVLHRQPYTYEGPKGMYIKKGDPWPT